MPNKVKVINLNLSPSFYVNMSTKKNNNNNIIFFVFKVVVNAFTFSYLRKQEASPFTRSKHLILRDQHERSSSEIPINLKKVNVLKFNYVNVYLYIPTPFFFKKKK
jgi:hypothetical protein